MLIVITESEKNKKYCFMKSAVLVLFVVVWLTFFGLEQSTVRHHFRFVRHIPTLFLLLFSSFFLFFFKGRGVATLSESFQPLTEWSVCSHVTSTRVLSTPFFFFFLAERVAPLCPASPLNGMEVAFNRYGTSFKSVWN